MSPRPTTIASGAAAMAALVAGCVLAVQNDTGVESVVPYFIAGGSGIPGYEDGDRDLARLALGDWARASGGRIRFVEVDSEEDATVRLIWAPPSGLYGEMRQVDAGGRIRTLVYVTPSASDQDPAFREDPLLRDTIVYLTCVHELGHAIGLPHTSEFDDIMYSFGYGGDIVEYFMRYRRRLETRDDIAGESVLSANDRRVLDAILSGPPLPIVP